MTNTSTRSSTTQNNTFAETSTDGMENFWSLLKRGFSGTHVSVEPFHLFRYIDEQAFRYNNRADINDADRFNTVMGQLVGKRLT